VLVVETVDAVVSLVPFKENEGVVEDADTVVVLAAPKENPPEADVVGALADELKLNPPFITGAATVVVIVPEVLDTAPKENPPDLVSIVLLDAGLPKDIALTFGASVEDVAAGVNELLKLKAGFSLSAATLETPDFPKEKVGAEEVDETAVAELASMISPFAAGMVMLDLLPFNAAKEAEAAGDKPEAGMLNVPIPVNFSDDLVGATTGLVLAAPKLKVGAVDLAGTGRLAEVEAGIVEAEIVAPGIVEAGIVEAGIVEAGIVEAGIVGVTAVTAAESEGVTVSGVGSGVGGVTVAEKGTVVALTVGG